MCQALWLGISNKSFNPHKKTKAGIIITAINPIIKMRKPGLKKESDLLQSVSIQACVCLCARTHTRAHTHTFVIEPVEMWRVLCILSKALQTQPLSLV